MSPVFPNEFSLRKIIISKISIWGDTIYRGFYRGLGTKDHKYRNILGKRNSHPIWMTERTLVCLCRFVDSTVKTLIQWLLKTEGRTSERKKEGMNETPSGWRGDTLRDTSPGSPFFTTETRCRLLLHSGRLSVYSFEPSPKRESTRDSIDVGVYCKTNVGIFSETQTLRSSRYGLGTRCLWHSIIPEKQTSVIRNPVRQRVVLYWLCLKPWTFTPRWNRNLGLYPSPTFLKLLRQFLSNSTELSDNYL